MSSLARNWANFCRSSLRRVVSVFAIPGPGKQEVFAAQLASCRLLDSYIHCRQKALCFKAFSASTTNFSSVFYKWVTLDMINTISISARGLKEQKAPVQGIVQIHKSSSLL